MKLLKKIVLGMFLILILVNSSASAGPRWNEWTYSKQLDDGDEFTWKVVKSTANGETITERNDTYSLAQDDQVFFEVISDPTTLDIEVIPSQNKLDDLFWVQVNDKNVSDLQLFQFIFPNTVIYENGTQFNYFEQLAAGVGGNYTKDFMVNNNGTDYSISDGVFSASYSAGVVTQEVKYRVDTGVMEKWNISSRDRTLEIDLTDVDEDDNGFASIPTAMFIAAIVMVPIVTKYLRKTKNRD